MVRGMQGDDPNYVLMNASPKHFAAEISDADLVQTYLRPFANAFEAGALATMCSHSQLNGVSGCLDSKLLTRWLRDENKFNRTYVIADNTDVRPSRIPSLCTRSTRAGIEWCCCNRAVCMARSR